jgi:hypothetical protein
MRGADMNQISEQERIRRREHVRDTRAALAQGESVEARLKARNVKAEAWTQWFRYRMDATRCTDPMALLPEALALLEQLADDRVTAAIAEMKTKLKGALS